MTPANAVAASGDISVAATRTMAPSKAVAQAKRSSRRPWKAIVQISIARPGVMIKALARECKVSMDAEPVLIAQCPR